MRQYSALPSQMCGRGGRGKPMAAELSGSCIGIEVIMWRDSQQKNLTHHVSVSLHYSVVVVTVSVNVYWQKSKQQSEFS